MRHIKAATLVYVEAIPNGRLINNREDIPAHVRIEWLDDQGQQNFAFPNLQDGDLEIISKLPDKGTEF